MRAHCSFKEGGRTYTYEVPDDAEVGDVLLVEGNGGADRKVTVVSLGSDYDGECKEARR